ncbi:carbon-nitrogen hydrolase family protein [Youngiibacter multivorans]|uniref:Amidohydrolase n=1 Tax=Youngiibacter multivorans TaxID=937251 RepID=A0ABS4G844_9CLOT|nr:carbon-nitrogen hydrolase family protein [Youngiibacter multivorans]MBP1920721.1 putative amidohydrolase [Youngiibacter multivorans]
MKIGLVQLMVTDDKEKNLRKAEKFVRIAAEDGADMVVLPEIFNCPYDNAYFRDFAEEKFGETWQRLSRMASDNKVYLVGGSIPVLNCGKLFNTGYVFNRQGDEIHEHSKVHLFDVNIEGGVRFMESETFSPGTTFGVFDTEFGKIGMGICFDIRFSEEWLKMEEMGAIMCVVPAAFNMTTGPAHWELTFRGRALDNEMFMVGVGPARNMDMSYHAYGHSIITSPWGEVVDQLGFDEEVKVVDIDLSLVKKIRDQLPIVNKRRENEG